MDICYKQDALSIPVTIVMNSMSGPEFCPVLLVRISCDAISENDNVTWHCHAAD